MTGKKSQSEVMQDFVNKMNRQHNKHLAVLRVADSHLAEMDYDGFERTYADLSKEDVVEIVQAMHIRVNDTAYDREQTYETLFDVFRDISNCKDFVAFDLLRQKARSILLAQDMAQRGASEADIRKVMDEGNAGSSPVIVQ